MVAYDRNRYKKNKQNKEYKWGVINCVTSFILYCYLLYEIELVVLIVAIPALLVILFMWLFD
ncbi:hypothetical protein CLV45_4207 [Hymenobacter chitinivorans DSM 11115]|uniref:Uncharacterized protein n=1 Tax=Hymenobacter chitinivorans DSM 11115 TaxID=1121954 RepID=A0A2M9AS32_9BACT|nr:hypothetical protein CLV45_4207 [Hymenobacter chitinivorans DSM 11115]